MRNSALILRIVLALSTVFLAGAGAPATARTPTSKLAAATPTPAPGGTEWPKQIRFLSFAVGTENFGMHTEWMAAVQKVMKMPAGAFPGVMDSNFLVVSRGGAEFSAADTIYPYQARNGTGVFKRKITNLRWITGFTTTGVAAVVLKSSPIKRLSDLNGKKVALFTKGGAAELFALLQMKELGITPQTIQAAGGMTTNMGPVGMSDALIDGAIDVSWINTGLEARYAALSLADERFGVRVLEIPRTAADSLVKREPYMMKVQISGGLYKGNPQPVKVIGEAWGVVGRADLPEDFVYQVLKVLYSDEVVKATRTKWRMSNHFGDLDVALAGAVIPMHPGAAKFFREKGIDVTTKGITVEP